MNRSTVSHTSGRSAAVSRLPRPRRSAASYSARVVMPCARTTCRYSWARNCALPVKPVALAALPQRLTSSLLISGRSDTASGTSATTRLAKPSTVEMSTRARSSGASTRDSRPARSALTSALV